MKIIKYKNARHIDVKFENGYTTYDREYKEFKKGRIKDLYYPEIYSIGYVGEKYSHKDYPYFYNKWQSMLERCYDEKSLNKHPTYKGCTVCDEWKSFSIFCEWCLNNYYSIDNEEMHLDKDILIKNNKIYSPKTSIFVPQRINKLLLKHNNARGKYLIGVTFSKTNNKYIARCNIDKNNRKIIGCYDTELEAFNAYKLFKEKYIKQVADKYKTKIPQKLYNALYNYKVEITD